MTKPRIPLRGPVRILAATIAVVVFLNGCARTTTRRVEVTSAALEQEKKKQRELAVREYFRDLVRLRKVAYRVARAGVRFCKDAKTYSAGLSFRNEYIFGSGRNETWRRAARAALGVGEAAEVAIVHRDSPAEKAGLEVGDVPLSLAGWRVPVGEKAISAIVAKFRATAKDAKGPIKLRLRRNGKEMEASISPVEICGYGFGLKPGEELNAFADGKSVFVTQRMMEFARSDDELAVVIGHEMAHNFMKHVEAKKQNAVAGGIAGLLVDILFAAGGVNTGGRYASQGMNLGARAYSQDFEAEADYVGLYAVAAAGYDITAAPDFWRRVATRNTKAIGYATTHPTTAYRAAALEKTVAEIARKKRSGLPLVPEPKKAEKTVTDPEADPAD